MDKDDSIFDQPSPSIGLFPFISLPDDDLQPIESPVVENPDFRLAQFEDGVVDFDRGSLTDGTLEFQSINTQANSLFAEIDLGALSTNLENIETPRANVQIGDASDGGNAVRLSVSPEDAVPVLGFDTGVNSNGDKVFETSIPVGPGTVTVQSDDPVGSIVGGIVGAALPGVDDDAFDQLNLTDIVTGGRFNSDPEPEDESSDGGILDFFF